MKMHYLDILFTSLLRNLSAIQDREICCYSVSCKEKDNIGKLLIPQKHNRTITPGPAVVVTRCPCGQISRCSGSSSTQSRGEAESDARFPRCSCGPGPPTWSRVPDSHPSTASVMYALSAHYRHHLHHPLHYHRYVAPVQHYRSAAAAVSGVWANVPVLCSKVDCPPRSQSVGLPSSLSSSFTANLTTSLCNLTVEPLWLSHRMYLFLLFAKQWWLLSMPSTPDKLCINHGSSALINAVHRVWTWFDWVLSALSWAFLSDRCRPESLICSYKTGWTDSISRVPPHTCHSLIFWFGLNENPKFPKEGKQRMVSWTTASEGNEKMLRV